MSYHKEPLAIIGSGCRFAGGASSPSKLWDLLLHPRDLSAPPPNDRFHLPGFYDGNADRHGHTNVSGSYFLDRDPRTFDAAFFNISPKEAEAIDPQQRMLLEVVYEAMESAGLTLQGLQGSDTSVYVGLMIRDYMDIQARDPDYFSQYMVTGTSSALNANRISYFFDWRGPSMTIDTACSSSLVAVHQAVQGLRSGESRVACVAATNLLLGPELFISAAKMHMVSPRSRMWDASADGYARGDGIATIILKTLSNAILDGDHIEAIIRQTGVNSDGRTQGITLPNPGAQVALIRETYKQAALDIARDEDRPQYFEAHGTGTQAGDPLEASAIHEAFYGKDVLLDRKSLIWVGSIKTVVGHTEGTAGLAGMLKAILAMKHRIIPPNLHFQELNPRIAPFSADLRVPTEPVPWPWVRPGMPLRASINSFGFGGTNAHVILESFEAVNASTQSELHRSCIAAPIMFSAHTEKALRTMITQYSVYLKTHGASVCLRDLVHTLRKHRSSLPVKAFFSATSIAEAAAQMDSKLLSGQTIGSSSRRDADKQPCILGIFTGQGAHWPGMGRRLILSSRLFSETIDSLEQDLARLPDAPGWSLRSELLAPESMSRLSEAAISQPLCTAIAIALVELLRASGISFSTVVGHSSGEIGAAYAAGVITAGEAIRIAYYRGVHAKLAGMQGGTRGRRGGMVAVGTDLDDAKKLCSESSFLGRLQVAAANSPSSVTLSGDLDAVEEVRALLSSRGVSSRQLQVDTAYHSFHMEPCAEPYMASLRACEIRAREPLEMDCVWISSVYGFEDTPSANDLGAKYWKENMVKSVLFSEAVERAVIECGLFDAAIEVGPHPSLKGPVTKTVQACFENELPYFATLRRGEDDVRAFGETLGSLWMQFGAEFVDLEGYVKASEPLGLPPPALVKDHLPSYPWDHSQPLWRESRLSREYRLRTSPSHELLGNQIPGGSSKDRLSWRNILLLSEVSWMAHYRVQGRSLVPTSAFCLMAIEAGMRLASVSDAVGEIGVVELRSMELVEAISVPDSHDGVELITSVQELTCDADDDASLVAEVTVMFGPPDGTQQLRKAASGKVVLYCSRSTLGNGVQTVKVPELHEDSLDADRLYASLSEMGLEYTGPFRKLQHIQSRWRHSKAMLDCAPDKVSGLDPFLIESCVQGALAAFAAPGDTALWSIFLPFRLQRLSLNLNCLEARDCAFEMHSRIVETSSNGFSRDAAFAADIEILDRFGRVVVEFEELQLSTSATPSADDDREIFSQTVLKRTASGGLLDKECGGEESAQRKADMEACRMLEERALWLTARQDAITAPLSILAELFEDFVESRPSCPESLLPMLLEQHPLLARSRRAITDLLDRASHCFANLRVLEIGHPSLGPTKIFHEALKVSSSFTFASACLSQDQPSDDIQLISLTSLDLSSELMSPTFERREFDVVIVSCIALGQDTQTLDNALAGLRHILQPGGLLLLLEPTNDFAWIRLFSRALHASVEDTRDFHGEGSPFSTVDMDQALRRSGFAGIDSQLPRCDDPGSAMTVILSQAVDQTIDLLRHPLQPSALSILAGAKLLVVGGTTSRTIDIAQAIVSRLGPWASDIVIRDSLLNFHAGPHSYFAGAIILADLDRPVVESLSTQAYDAISQLLRHSSHLVWVTSGSTMDDPGQAASAGLVNLLSERYPSCRIQLLDVGILETNETVIISSFIRLLISSLSDNEHCKHLGTLESQVSIRNGREYIPRLLPARDMNDRLNSRRRIIRKNVTETTPMTFIPHGSLQAATFHAEPLRCPVQDPIVISHSLPFALQVSEGNFLYLLAGVSDANMRILGLSTTLSRPGQALAVWKVPAETNISCRELVELASSIVVSRNICDLLPPGDSVVFEPSRLVASLILSMSVGTDRKVCFVTSRPLEPDEEQWIALCPHASKLVIQSALPRNPKLFFVSPGGANRLSMRIQRQLPADTQAFDGSEFFKLRAQTREDMTAQELTQRLTDIGLTTLDAFHNIPNRPSLPQIRFNDLLNGTTRLSTGLSIFDWAQVSDVSIHIESLDPASHLSVHKIYVLIELEDQLLKSIASWLVSCGVSRLLIIDHAKPTCLKRDLPPHVSVQWASVDLTDEIEVRSLFDGILDTAGVIYGGAGPSRSLVGEQWDTLEMLKGVMKGSRYVSDALMDRDPDFFIILSSMDKEYAPLNTYMSSLAFQGHSRGLAVSLVNLDAQWKSVQDSEIIPFMRISESDMHYILTEAILAARSPSGNPVIHTGIKRMDMGAQPEASARLPQLLSPLFSHHTVRVSHTGEDSCQSRPKNLQERLAVCTDVRTASLAIQDSFLAHLADILKVVPDALGPGDGLASLGVDSLSASDIRAWFIKEVDADIPMIKILGGTSIARLCDEAAAMSTFGHDKTEMLGLPVLAKAPDSGLFSAALIQELATSDTGHSAFESSESPCGTGATTPAASAGLADSVEGDIFKSHKIERQSLNQTRFWFPSLYLNQKTAFNCTTCYSLSGPLNPARLETAFRRLIERHEIFRTAFFNDQATGEPMQRILPSSPFTFAAIQGDRVGDYELEFRRIQQYVFDLAVADTFIASVISHGDDEHTLITGYHHIIMDGVSWQITLRELAWFYESDSPPALPPMAQYVDFAMKQGQRVSEGSHAQKLAYWRKEFSTPPPVMPLLAFSRARGRKPLTSYDTRNVVLDLDASLVSKIKKASLGAKSTSFHFYLAAFAVLAHRCLDLTELCLGIVDANRSDKAFLNTIGCFIDMLPLKLKMNRKEMFSHTISGVRRKAYGALENSGIPLETLIQELQIPASATANPLFQVLINYRLGALRAPRMGDSEMRFLTYDDSKAPFDLTLSIDEKDDGTGMLTFSMHDYMFDEQGAALLTSTYVHLLDILSDNPDRRLCEIPIANEAAASLAITAGTGPTLDIEWPQSQTVSQRMDSQMQQHPDRLAVKDLRGLSRTYLETHRRVNALAKALADAGVSHGSRVAACCEPSVDVVACILATHRVGATYIPLDVRNSSGRLRAIVEECEPVLVLCDNDTGSRLRDFVRDDQPIIDISAVAGALDVSVPNVSRLSDGAFILYTSGSTGTPKGILLTQANMALHCGSVSQRLGLTPDDVFLQQSALGFDAALGQMLYAMTSGGSLILGDNRGDPRDLASLMESEKVTFTLMIISEMTALLQSTGDVLSRCKSWRLALCGGEAFPGRLLSMFKSLELPDLVVYNAYGPTEGSIITSLSVVPYRDGLWAEDATVPCGPPLPNYGVYVVDDQLRPVPLGWPGELCVAGPCVSSGYVNQPALTAAKFRPFCLERPVDAPSRQGWTSLYQTGDRACMMDDGSFVFLGRIDGDTQVKLRGIRIELGEISGALVKASAGTVIDAVTVVRGEDEQMLVSFVVLGRDTKARLEHQDGSASSYLRKLVQSLTLPTYMRPAVAIALDQLPITARGKLDTSALAAYEIKEDAEEAEEEFTETEQRLKSIWSAVLPDQGLKIRVRRASDFFSVGGNSLLLIRVRAAIRNIFEVDISLAELFQSSSLESLADSIDGRSDRHQERTKIDWNAETYLDASLPVARTVYRLVSGSSEQPITIIVTGSTGFLGREIVKQLIETPLIGRIHCIAVRNARALPASDKIVLHNGDLSDRLLGLDEASAREMFSSASAVIHNGAEVSHMKSYQTLRGPNVHSTQQLIELALRTAHESGTPVPSFHYISSAGVGGLVGNALEFPEISVSGHPPATDAPNGYVAAKYVSECLLERAASRLGLPVTIHRPSNISGPGVQDRDIVHSIWRWSKRMRAAPDLVASGAVGAFDFVGVENCAAGVVASVFEGLRGATERKVRYVHQSSDSIVTFEAFGEVLERQVGDRVAVLSFDEWIERAMVMGMDGLVAQFLMQTRGALFMPLLLKQR